MRVFLAEAQTLSNTKNGDKEVDTHIAIWPSATGFSDGTKRVNWIVESPYMREYSYFKEFFRTHKDGHT
jgi:hypothetical protein